MSRPQETLILRTQEIQDTPLRESLDSRLDQQVQNMSDRVITTENVAVKNTRSGFFELIGQFLRRWMPSGSQAYPSSHLLLCLTMRGDPYVFKPDTISSSSKVLYKMFEAGPKFGRTELDHLKLLIVKCMRWARTQDKDCTFQLGSLAVLKYTDAGPKWWKQETHWTPTILAIHRTWTPFSNLLGFLQANYSTVWTIKGRNLETAKLQAATMDKVEDFVVKSRYKTKSGEDVLLCEEPPLVQNLGPLFKTKLYICASKSLEVEKGVTCILQSKPENVQTAYWNSVVIGFLWSPWMGLGLPSLLQLGRLIYGTYGGHAMVSNGMAICINVASLCIVMAFTISTVKLWRSSARVPKITLQGPDHTPAGVTRITGSLYEFYAPKFGVLPEVDIIFFHGLPLTNDNRDVYWKTWSSDGKTLWPRTFLGEQAIPNSRILAVSYDSFGSSLYSEAELLLNAIVAARVGQGQRPVVLVGHSLGGLVIKELLVIAESRRILLDDNSATFLRNVRGVLFYTIPDYGSKHLQDIASARPEVEKFLGLQMIYSKYSTRPNDFREFRARHKVKTCAIVEGRPTKLRGISDSEIIVQEGSARVDCDSVYLASSDDHFSVCKPKSVHTIPFLCLVKFVKDCVEAWTLAEELESSSQEALPGGAWTLIEKLESSTQEALPDVCTPVVERFAKG